MTLDFGIPEFSGNYLDPISENPQASEFQTRMFPASNQPDGAFLIDARSNTSFWNFDQSKINAVLSDVLSAGVKSGIQFAADSVNRNQTNSNPYVSSLFRNFQSTQTGVQLNTASYATKFQNWLSDPIVWMFALLGVVMLVIVKR